MRLPWAVLLLTACGQGAPPAANVQAPAKTAAPAPAPTPTNNVVESPPGDPPVDIAGMSPRQRRAYEKGLADCRRGRYEPDPWPEAYRIGCAAANDEGGR